MKISASVICMDPLNIERDVRILDRLGIDSYHVDVMDRSFVPRMGIYPEIAAAISEFSSTPIDVHLMVDDPERHLDDWCEIKRVRRILVHAGPNKHNLFRFSREIAKRGKSHGLVLNLSESYEEFREIVRDSFDSVMIMGINPGVLRGPSYPHIAADKLHRFVKDQIHVILDGAVTFDTFSYSYDNVTCVVGSSTLFKDVELGSKREQQITDNFIKIQEHI
jgi:ribulose-phosphate 3-epimerase